MLLYLASNHFLALTAVCSPADVIKSRVMHSSEKGSVLELIKTSLREEGARFLFKGWTPAFVRLAPNTVLMFVFMEVSLVSSFT